MIILLVDLAGLYLYVTILQIQKMIAKIQKRILEAKMTKRKLKKQQGYTLEQKFWTTVAVVLVILYIVLGGYTTSAGVVNILMLFLPGR